MRISDWSSDVCSSDLHDHLFEPPHRGPQIGALGVDRGIVHQQLVLARAEALEDRRDVRLRRAIAVEIILHLRSEEHTSELQSLMRISYAVFCLKKKT